MAKINLPIQLVKITREPVVEINASTIEELFLTLIGKYPDLEKRLILPNGDFNKFVNIFVNEEDIRFLEGKNTSIKPTDEITIVPAIAGR